MLLYTIVIFNFAYFSAAQESDTPVWKGNDVPDPRVDPAACNADEPSNVCDPDRLWASKYEINYMREALLDMEQNITAVEDVDLSGFGEQLCANRTDTLVKFYVVRVAKMVESSDKKETNVITFTNNLIKHWKLDAAQCRNYVLIIIINDYANLFIKDGEHVPEAIRQVAQQGPPPSAIDQFNKEHYAEGVIEITRYALEAAMRSGEERRAERVRAASILGNQSDKWWRNAIIIAACVSGGMLLIALLGWCLYACYQRKRKTGSWSRPIPIHVKRLNDPSAIYPEFVGTMSTAKPGFTGTMRTTRSTSTDMYGETPSMSPSPTTNGKWYPHGVPQSRLPHSDTSDSPSPPPPVYGQLRSQPTQMTPPPDHDDDSLNEEGYAQPETDRAEQPRVAHMVQYHR